MKEHTYQCISRWPSTQIKHVNNDMQLEMPTFVLHMCNHDRHCRSCVLLRGPVMPNGNRTVHKFYSHPGCNVRRGHCPHPRFWNGYFRVSVERMALIAIFEGNAIDLWWKHDRRQFGVFNGTHQIRKVKGKKNINSEHMFHYCFYNNRDEKKRKTVSCHWPHGPNRRSRWALAEYNGHFWTSSSWLPSRLLSLIHTCAYGYVT